MPIDETKISGLIAKMPHRIGVNTAEMEYLHYLLRRAGQNPAILHPTMVPVEAELCLAIAKRAGLA